MSPRTELHDAETEAREPANPARPNDGPAFESLEQTAHWVAAYRARAARAGAVDVDPFALRLAGLAGERLAEALPGSRTASWAIAARTRAIDAMIVELLERRPIDAVVNLGAGLDARPQRLALPRHVRWIEVDHPRVLEHKAAALPGPLACYTLERAGLDLFEPSDRVRGLRSLFRIEGAALVLSEGFVVYLTELGAAQLARDLAGGGFDAWIVDLIAPDVLKRLRARWAKSLASGGAELRFAPENGPGFFEAHGWAVHAFRPLVDEVRAFPGAPRLLDRFDRARAAKLSLSGVACLTRPPSNGRTDEARGAVSAAPATSTEGAGGS